MEESSSAFNRSQSIKLAIVVAPSCANTGTSDVTTQYSVLILSRKGGKLMEQAMKIDTHGKRSSPRE
jgi:hypothetical protein